MKLMKVMCVLVLVFAVSAVAYAETQSVKVSGDIEMRAFARDNFDLDRNDPDNNNNGIETNNWATYLTSTAEIQIDADLTDNVAGTIRLANFRVWGDDLYTSSNNGELGRIDDIGDTVVANQVAPGTDAFQVSVDLAYIELKEFLYSPLTLKIGRQDLWFGKGFIIGNSLQGSTMSVAYPQEYTPITSFDAVRATLDYDPWTIDAVWAKMSENARRADDDINLMGVNIGYIFDSYNGEAEAYYWFKQDRNPSSQQITAMTVATVTNVYDNNVHTMGLRGSFDPIEDWTVALEGAYQAGGFLGVNQQASSRSRSAWAIDALIECRYWQDDFAWRPVGSVEYIWYSGQKDIGNRNPSIDGNYSGWDKMYRGKFDTAIREFQNVFYRTTQASTPSTTNQHQILLRGSVEPTDSLTAQATFGYFWLDQRYSTNLTDKELGAELDLQLTWDYTEDVQFGFLAGWFFPGKHFGDADDTATDLVGTVKLSF